MAKYAIGIVKGVECIRIAAVKGENTDSDESFNEKLKFALEVDTVNYVHFFDDLEDSILFSVFPTVDTQWVFNTEEEKYIFF